ncbi:hypothetical protein HNR44_001361 [Geomicrobium halophilum]|uniref:Uncharacterized protein n=1 Tax=Geomicrobium halophilum TaxID=549000 RepID=A0A841PYI2_9BACL|nr:hypothetical protein [Geomicrobium halophilum]MBB6449412.1 hypothetical protein [Geomicrobium halophilum]
MDRKERKVVISLSVIVLILLLGGLVVPINVGAPSDTRTILDHTTQNYVSPSCIDDAEVTNYLQETTYGHALSLDYDAESSCSAEFYQESDVPLFVAMLQMIGVSEQKWSEEDMLHSETE